MAERLAAMNEPNRPSDEKLLSNDLRAVTY